MNKIESESFKVKRYLRAKDVAQCLSIGLSTVWLYAKQGKLHPIKLSSRVTVFNIEDVDKLLDSELF